MKVKPYYWRNEKLGSTFGTFFEYADGWVTAAHVYEEMNYDNPPFANSKTINRPYIGDIGLDACLMGCDLSKVRRPIEPVEGMEVVSCGYPAGCTRAIEYRKGNIYLDREDENAGGWIITHEEKELPVIVGMSGSPVFGKVNNSWQLVGILIVRNSFFDHDGNAATPVRESSDFQPMCEVYDAII